VKSNLAHKLRRAPIWLINGLWAVPAVLLIRALRPIVLIRMGTLESTRIGHFVCDGAQQLVQQQQATNTFDWLWLGETCNSQWERMIRRSLPVHACVKYLDRWNRVLPGGTAHEQFHFQWKSTKDVKASRAYYEMRTPVLSAETDEVPRAYYDVKIPFLRGETDEALKWLRNKGWKDGEPFVCLLVRDDEYLANDPLHSDGTSQAYERRAYHDYRNSDINSYLPAIEWLTEQGVWVIRMGKLMAKPLPTGLDQVIDYAFDPDKSDLLDIWLFANCTGCVSTGTGPDVVALAYDIPVLFVNALPLTHLILNGRPMWVPKHLLWSSDGRFLSVGEHLENGWMLNDKYEKAGITIMNLSPEEITSAVQEFWHRNTGPWQEEPDDIQRQERFWVTFKKWSDDSEYYGLLRQEIRVGAAWLSWMEKMALHQRQSADHVE
jgi:putative glycosyltransferase (TIGR04372 family)